MIKKILLAMLLIAPTAMMAQQKVAHFDLQKVMAGLPEMLKAQSEMETLGKKYETDLKTMQNEFLAKQESYKKTADSLPENMRARKEQELQDLYNRIQQAQQDNQEAWNKAYQEKMQPISAKVTSTVEAIAKEGGYTYVIDKTAAQNNYLFINDNISEDVTQKIMTRIGATATPKATTAPKTVTRTTTRK